jgi:hypothetical protein
MPQYPAHDPHLYDIEEVIVGINNDRGGDSYNITTDVAEIVFYEHLEKMYITGSITFTDHAALVENLDISGTEVVSIRLKLFQSSYSVTKSFIIREITSTVPVTDTVDMVTFALIDYDAFVNTLLNVNKVYEGRPGKIISDILLDHFGSTKRLFRTIDENVQADLSSEIPEIAAEAQAAASSNELQGPMRFIVPNMNPYEAIEVIRNRATNLMGAPFYAYASLVDKNIRYYDLQTLINAPAINTRPYQFGGALAQTAGGIGDELSIQLTHVDQKNVENTLQFIRNGDIGASYEYIDPTLSTDYKLAFDAKLALNKLWSTSSSITNGFTSHVDTVSTFGGRTMNEFQSKRMAYVAPSSTFDGVNNIYEEGNAAGHAAKPTAKSLRNLLGKYRITVDAPGRNFLPTSKFDHFTTGKNINIQFIANNDPAQGGEFDQKKSGKYLIYSCKHAFTNGKYSVRLNLAKITRTRGDFTP